jgi:ketosteroid isomerase-like protein
MMKKAYLVAFLALALLAFSACQNQSASMESNANTKTEKPDPNVVEEVKAVLAKHDKALNDKDLDALMATFSNDPKTVVLGTGQGERFVGQQAIRDAYTEIQKDYDAGTLETDCEWKTGGVDAAGTTAWVAATCKAQDSLKNVKRNYVLNVSGALAKQDGNWRFVMLHMSNAPNYPPPPAAGNTKGASGK